MGSHRRDAEHLLLAVATGVIWGTIEAFVLRSHSPQIPGSGDPWLILEGLALYGILAAISGIAAGRILPQHVRVTSITAPLFFFLWMYALYEVNSLIPGNFSTLRGIFSSLVLTAIAFAAFWYATKLLNPISPFLRAVVLSALFFCVVFALWQSPFRRKHFPALKKIDTPNIVLVTMDTTRADHLTPYGYARNTSPFLAQLAKSATLFENAYSVSSWTLPSHSSLFTGKLPSVHGAIYTHWWLDSSETTMAEILQNQGYQTAAFVSGPFLLPSFNIQQGFQYYDDQLDPGSGLQRFMVVKIVRRFTKKRLPWIDGQRNGKQVTDHALSWLQDQTAPFFLFVNYFDPHDPYRPPPPFDSMYDSGYKGRMNGSTEKLFKNRQTGERIGRDGHPLTEADYHHLTALYDGEIRFMDEQIRRLVEALQKRQDWKDTIVILISDHGESIGDHKLLDHGHTLYEEQIHVPLIILGAGIPEGKRISALVRSIDVLPTLLQHLHLSVPRDIQGLSFESYLTGGQSDGRPYIGEIFRDPDTRVKRFQRNQKAIRDAQWKFFWSSDGNHELYDLTVDPHEIRNQGLETTEGGRLQQIMFQYLRTLPQRVLQKTIPLDESTLENLEANSYIN